MDFYQKKTDDNEKLILKMNIVKYIGETKMAEDEVRKNTLMKIQKDQKILSIIAKKKESELENMSVEDLEKLLQ